MPRFRIESSLEFPDSRYIVSQSKKSSYLNFYGYVAKVGDKVTIKCNRSNGVNINLLRGSDDYFTKLSVIVIDGQR